MCNARFESFASSSNSTREHCSISLARAGGGRGDRVIEVASVPCRLLLSAVRLPPMATTVVVALSTRGASPASVLFPPPSRGLAAIGSTSPGPAFERDSPTALSVGSFVGARSPAPAAASLAASAPAPAGPPAVVSAPDAAASGTPTTVAAAAPAPVAGVAAPAPAGGVMPGSAPAPQCGPRLLRGAWVKDGPRVGSAARKSPTLRRRPGAYSGIAVPRLC